MVRVAGVRVVCFSLYETFSCILFFLLSYYSFAQIGPIIDERWSGIAGGRVTSAGYEKFRKEDGGIEGARAGYALQSVEGLVPGR